MKNKINSILNLKEGFVIMNSKTKKKFFVLDVVCKYGKYEERSWATIIPINNIKEKITFRDSGMYLDGALIINCYKCPAYKIVGYKKVRVSVSPNFEKTIEIV